MGLLRREVIVDDVTTDSGPGKLERITLYLGDADFGDVCETSLASRPWRWQTDFSCTVETAEGVDTYAGELGSRGHADTREEAIAVLERKAERFLDHIGVGQRMAAQRQLIRMLKRYGNGMRWWRRTDGKTPNWLALAVLKFEEQFGEVHEAELQDAKALIDELDKTNGQAILGDE